MSAITPLHSLPPSRRAARIPLDSDGPFSRCVRWASRRLYGKELDPLRAGLHHRPVLLAALVLEAAASRWKKLSPTLNALAVMAVAREIGCSWCVDFGYWESHHRGVDPRKLDDVGRWRDSEVYSPLERAVLEYAVAADRDSLRMRARAREIADELRAHAPRPELTAEAAEAAELLTWMDHGFVFLGFREYAFIVDDEGKRLDPIEGSALGISSLRAARECFQRPMTVSSSRWYQQKASFLRPFLGCLTVMRGLSSPFSSAHCWTASRSASSSSQAAAKSGSGHSV